ncbi:MAG: hypothetical protein AB7I30_14475 [Isosphaeraceae bacterium]
MRPPRPTLLRPLLAVAAALTLSAALVPSAVLAQESYKIEPLKEAPPEALAAPLRDALQAEGYRVVDGQGKPYADLWIRKSVPATEAPGKPKGAILFPFLTEGELIGALRYVGEGYDNRDQAIAKGVYTLRYGLQPVNGDHLGVSPYRDYALLLPAAKDRTVAVVPRKALEERSSETAGTSHPAILLMTAAQPGGPTPPAIVRDEERNTWAAALPLSTAVQGSPTASPVTVGIVLIGVLGG